LLLLLLQLWLTLLLNLLLAPLLLLHLLLAALLLLQLLLTLLLNLLLALLLDITLLLTLLQNLLLTLLLRVTQLLLPLHLQFTLLLLTRLLLLNLLLALQLNLLLTLHLQLALALLRIQRTLQSLTTSLPRHQALLTRLKALLSRAQTLLTGLKALLAGTQTLLTGLEALLARLEALLTALANGRANGLLVVDGPGTLLEVLQVLLLQSGRKRSATRRHGHGRKERTTGTHARTRQAIPAIDDGACGDTRSKRDRRSYIGVDVVAAIRGQHDDRTLWPHHIRRRRDPFRCRYNVFRHGQEVMRILNVLRRRRRPPPAWRRREKHRVDWRLHGGKIAGAVDKIHRFFERRRRDVILDRVETRRRRKRRLQPRQPSAG